MRKQYHFKHVGSDVYIWDVDRLIELSQSLPVELITIDSIVDFDKPYWYQNPSNNPTCRSIAEHMKLALETDLQYPIILAADNSVMDGMHRVCKAYAASEKTIKARCFKQTPPHDYMNIDENDLEY